MRKDTKAVKAGQQTLFDPEELEGWKEEWKGMPEFNQEDISAWKSITLNFACKEDMEKFAKLIGQTITTKTRSIWYPQAEIGRMMNKVFIDEEEDEK